MGRRDAEEVRKQRLAELVRILQLPQEQLQHAQAVADLYITDERPDYRRWLVTFNLLAQNNQQYVERSYEVFLDSHGNLIADADYGTVLLEEKAADLSTNQELCYPPILETYRAYAEQKGSYLVREWSLASKAAYSEEVRPQVQAALSMGQLSQLQNPYSEFQTIHGEVLASTQFAYGLPSADHLCADEARSRANYALSESLSGRTCPAPTFD